MALAASQDLENSGGAIAPVNLKPLPMDLTLSQTQKAAIIIGLLGADSAGPVVAKLEDSHLNTFMETLSSLHEISRDVMLSAMADFIAELSAQKGAFRGGPEAVKMFMETVFEGERVARLLSGSQDAEVKMSSADIWMAVKKSSRPDLIAYLSSQRVELIGIILGQFSPEESGEILSDLPEKLGLSCVTYMSRGEQPDGTTTDMIAQLVREEFLLADDNSQEEETVTFMSELLSVLPRERREAMLDALKSTDTEKAEKIRAAMLTFEDLSKRLPTSAVSIIFKDYPAEDLAKMLKAGDEMSPDTIAFFFANIPQRMGGQLKEQVEDLSALPQKDAEKAISTFMGYVGKLEKDGKITLTKAVAADDAE